MQIYFIDNDDYFARKAILQDADENYFEDNDEQAIFFARGVLERSETALDANGRPLPRLVLSIVPIYLKKGLRRRPDFQGGQNRRFALRRRFRQTAGCRNEGENRQRRRQRQKLSILDTPSYENLCRYVMEYADGIILASDAVTPEIIELVATAAKPLLEYQSPDAEDFFDNYNRFYDSIQ